MVVTDYTRVKQGIQSNMFLNSGIDIKSYGIFLVLFLYADDVVILADVENELQKLIDLTDNWCRKWGLSINTNSTRAITTETTELMHFSNMDM